MAAKKSKSSPRVSRVPWLVRFIYSCLFLCILGLAGIAGVFVYYGAQLPSIDQLAVPKRPPNIAIVSTEGELLVNRGDSGGPAIRLAQLPGYFPKAFVAIEDRRFYHHFGIDPTGVGRAIVNNLRGAGGMQGGSTLTQQLAKNLFLTQERTFSRKIQEAILSVWLERKYTKDQILELYLNRVYFGSGAYGVEAAAQKYFGHGADRTTLAEAALLAGLMKAPTKLAPNKNPEGANERAKQVLAAMTQESFITAAMAQTAETHPAKAVRAGGPDSVNYAADYVMDMLDDIVGAIDEDIVVTTTLASPTQKAAERALVEELDKKGAKYDVEQGVIVAVDPYGAIRALVGGRNYSESQFNRAVSAKRQPGSAFKPFVYLAALERGLTPETIREDGPINIKGWRPENYSHEYFGSVTLTDALAMSLNTVAVKLGMEVGPKTVAKTAQRLGISSPLQANASLALGTSEVTPLELVCAYAPFSNGGLAVHPYIIQKVKTSAGKVLYQRRIGVNGGKVVEPMQVAMMNAMMQETLTTGTARKAELPGWQAAGKTGTSQDFRDAWFVGYTSQLVAGVWLGNDDNSPTKKASGGNLPVGVWSRFMKEALKNASPTPLPGQYPRIQRTPSGAAIVSAAQPQPVREPAKISSAPIDPTPDTTASMQSPGAESPPEQEKGLFERLFGN